MSALEARIDALYALPLAGFTDARNALAKSLSGEERARVKQLEKPTVVPWAVNQIYWHERAAWNRVMAAGTELRAAQLAALQGTPADLRDASTAHRAAVSAAVAAAQHLAERHGARPAADDLSRMLEAISLAAQPPGTPGRYTEAVQPAGFEALSGFTPALKADRPARTSTASPARHRPVSGSKISGSKTAAKAAAKAAAEAERRRAADDAARAKAAAAVEDAREALSAAEADYAAAQKAAEAAKRELVQAEHAVHTARVVVERHRAALADSESRLRSL